MDLSEQNEGIPAKVQVTSESILQDAFSNKDKPLERPKQSIQDLDELRSYQLSKRREFEQQLNKNRLNFGQWLRYAKWEVNHNHDYPRARSIFERALEVNVQHIPFWVHYIQFELSNRNINHARNLLDRAVTTLPRVDKLWFLYVQTEEALKNYQTVRNVFERWLEWKPNVSAWDAYINFEKRYDEFNNVRNIFVRFVECHPSGETWLKWIDFELNDVPANSQSVPRVRNVFELSVDTIVSNNDLKGDVNLALIINKWADWEISVKEFERARAIYQLLLENKDNKINITSNQRNQIYQAYIVFEKNFGNKDTIESSIILKRKLKYEEDLIKDPADYDTWWLYINILLQENDIDMIRSSFGKALSITPKDINKSIIWRRYILLWIKYALWEELHNNNIEGAREIWNKSLKVIPHKSFTFGKIWIHFAEFEIRNNEVDGLSRARQILGRSIGQASTTKPKRSLFNYYINLESKLGELDRVRKLYEKWFELSLVSDGDLTSIEILLNYINLEKSLQEHERCVALFKLGLKLIENDQISNKFVPLELLWMSFINYYKEEMKFEEARNLYRQLLAKVPSVKVWISLALFESSIPTEDQLKLYEESADEEFAFSINDTHRENTRAIFKEAEKFFKENKQKEDRLVILEAWKDYEKSHGSKESIEEVIKKLPTIVKKRKTVDGIDEEHLDYIFPQDEQDKPAPIPGINKFLENAKKWALNNQ